MLKSEYITAGAGVVVAVVMVLSYLFEIQGFSDRLAQELGDRISQTVEEATQEIGNRVDETVGEATQEIAVLLALTTETEASSRVWDYVYLEGEVAAAKKSYTKITADGIITSAEWKGNSRLLTEPEMIIIGTIIQSYKDVTVRVLTQKAYSELQALQVLSLELAASSGQAIAMSPYEKIGIIAGYIQEKKMEI